MTVSRGRIARWMLEEIGQPYRAEVVDYATTMKAPAYLAINPMGKVPALRHGDAVVTETAAICAYLADAFPQAGLAPRHGDKRRGPYYRWLFFIVGCGEPAMSNKSAGWEPSEEMTRRFGYGSYQLTMDTLEKAVAGKRHIAADHFTAADVFAASFLNFGMMFKVIEKRPAFETYVKPHIERPAWQKVMKQSGMAG